MAAGGHAAKPSIQDAIAAKELEPFEATVWRVTWSDDPRPLLGRGRRGRWTPGNVAVLYTSLLDTGAQAEMGYRLSLEPVWPELQGHLLHRIRVRVERLLRLETHAELAALGVDTARYHDTDYSVTRLIAAAAHRRGADALLVPSARANCLNLAIFRRVIARRPVLESSDPIDWSEFRARLRRAARNGTG